MAANRANSRPTVALGYKPLVREEGYRPTQKPPQAPKPPRGGSAVQPPGPPARK